MRHYVVTAAIRFADVAFESLDALWRDQVYGAPSETAASHACATNACEVLGRIHQEIEFFAAHFVISLQAAMGREKQPSHAEQIACVRLRHELQNPLILRGDMARAAEHIVGHRV